MTAKQYEEAANGIKEKYYRGALDAQHFIEQMTALEEERKRQALQAAMTVGVATTLLALAVDAGGVLAGTVAWPFGVAVAAGVLATTVFSRGKGHKKL